MNVLTTRKRILFRIQTTLCMFQLLTFLLRWLTAPWSTASGSFHPLFIQKCFLPILHQPSKGKFLWRQNEFLNLRMTNTKDAQEAFFIENDEEGSTPSYSTNTNEEISASRTRNVRFVSPLLLYGYRPAVEEYDNGTLCNKPLLIYLPGFDGTYLSPFLQFPELHTLFDIRCLTMGMDDRSTFDELQSDVIQYIEQECRAMTTSANGTQNATSTLTVLESATAQATRTKSISSRAHSRRNVYIVGESFGGILALLVSMNIQQQETQNDFVLRGLTLINAATCYDRSRLSVEGPKVSDMNDWFYPLGVVSRLLPLFTDQYSVAQLLLILQGKALPSVIDNPCKEAYMGRVAFSLPKVLSFMPKETLHWRLSNWLKEGCLRFGAATPPNQKILLNLKNVRTLIIAGEVDVALPSIAEAERLANTIPNSVVHVVDGAGHASTCGSRIDLAALFRCHFNKELGFSSTKITGQDKVGFTVSLQQILPWFINTSSSKTTREYRTSMIDFAANRSGVYFGMLPRYDNSSIGLSPLSYWENLYYRKIKHITIF